MGGKPLSSREEPLDVVNQFIPGATAWEDLAPLPTPKYNHAGLTLSDGTILVAGGVSTFVEDAEDPSPLAAARYVPSLNAWFPEAQPPVPVGGTNANALLLDDGSALIVISETLRFYPEPWQ
jgi:hypothetical protein